MSPPGLAASAYLRSCIPSCHLCLRLRRQWPLYPYCWACRHPLPHAPSASVWPSHPNGWAENRCWPDRWKCPVRSGLAKWLARSSRPGLYGPECDYAIVDAMQATPAVGKVRVFQILQDGLGRLSAERNCVTGFSGREIINGSATHPCAGLLLWLLSQLASTQPGGSIV